jgi:XRE family aerobic/anaerobic benzoate catabolism transcriptional regulator
MKRTVRSMPATAPTGTTKTRFWWRWASGCAPCALRRGMTRKAVALAADVSERHLANLEYGIGNASILVLQQVAAALQCSLAELTGDVTTSSPEWLLIRELLQGRDEATLRRARVAIGELLGTGGGAADAARSSRWR